MVLEDNQVVCELAQHVVSRGDVVLIQSASLLDRPEQKFALALFVSAHFVGAAAGTLCAAYESAFGKALTPEDAADEVLHLIRRNLVEALQKHAEAKTDGSDDKQMSE